MSIRVCEVDLRVLNMTARMPFRYGIVTMTALPHLFVVAEVEVDGRRQRGISADHLPPKWFTKNPQTHFRDDLVDMVDVIRSACGHATSAGAMPSVFSLWEHIYRQQKSWATAKGYPPLLWNFGVSLIERAAIDALCRAMRLPFSRVLRENHLGIDLRRIYRDVAGLEIDIGSANPGDLVPSQPLRQVISRHTVGLTDPLTDADIVPADRVDDGLPQSFESCVRAYGMTHFKIKLCGDVEKDLARLRRLGEIIERLCGSNYAMTVDANENFKSAEPFRQLWEKLTADPALGRFLSRLILVEQPMHRDVALSDGVKSAMAEWPGRPPMIIDESDAELGSLPRALECGYAGTSHKNCKGVVKGIANACLLESRRRATCRPHLLSGEDLSNVGPVALQADLTVAANLGITHIERNGQHYFKGLSMFPAEVQEQALRLHGDLYVRHPDGFPTMNIRAGRVEIGSLIDAPFGVGFEMDTSKLTRLEDWRFESLGLG